jgi:predicted nucleic acid-binding protein
MTTRRFLVDTNVLSELTKPRPSETVERWLHSFEPTSIASISLYEISFGIATMPRGRRRRYVEDWFDRIRAGVEVVAFDADAAMAAGRIQGELRRAGREIEKHDLLIAATAVAHRMTIATRNVGHFRGLGISVYDPFTDSYSI